MIDIAILRAMAAAGAPVEVILAAIEADQLADQLADLAKPTFVYLVEILTYGERHPIKVGIATNVRRRISQLGSMGISCPRLIGTFAFSSSKEARSLESDILQRFPRCPDYNTREAIWAQEDEILAFVEDHLPHVKFVTAAA